MSSETAENKSGGRLERVLAAGHFAITAETSPAATADLTKQLDRLKPLVGLADAVNVTDGATAKAHVSSLVVAGRMADMGLEPVLQFTVRDRNRIALQGDLLGAAASGVPNILCLTGDDPKKGEEPDAKPVFDLDSVGLIALAKKMRDDGKLNNDREIAVPPRLFIGAADAPFIPKDDWEPGALLAKMKAGADFVQTQYCFEVDTARVYLDRLADFDIPQNLPFLIGLGPLASAKQARWMDENLWGVNIPAPLIDRLDAADDPKEEGKRICIELMHQLSEIDGVAGVHLMAPRQEAAMAEVIAESGFLESRPAALSA